MSCFKSCLVVYYFSSVLVIQSSGSQGGSFLSKRSPPETGIGAISSGIGFETGGESYPSISTRSSSGDDCYVDVETLVDMESHVDSFRQRLDLLSAPILNEEDSSTKRLGAVYEALHASGDLDGASSEHGSTSRQRQGGYGDVSVKPGSNGISGSSNAMFIRKFSHQKQGGHDDNLCISDDDLGMSKLQKRGYEFEGVAATPWISDIHNDEHGGNGHGIPSSSAGNSFPSETPASCGMGTSPSSKISGTSPLSMGSIYGSPASFAPSSGHAGDNSSPVLSRITCASPSKKAHIATNGHISVKIEKVEESSETEKNLPGRQPSEEFIPYLQRRRGPVSHFRRRDDPVFDVETQRRIVDRESLERHLRYPRRGDHHPDRAVRYVHRADGTVSYLERLDRRRGIDGPMYTDRASDIIVGQSEEDERQRLLEIERALRRHLPYLQQFLDRPIHPAEHEGERQFIADVLSNLQRLVGPEYIERALPYADRRNGPTYTSWYLPSSTIEDMERLRSYYLPMYRPETFLAAFGHELNFLCNIPRMWKYCWRMF